MSKVVDVFQYRKDGINYTAILIGFFLLQVFLFRDNDKELN